jgi:SAM-dependent methyltransferase
MAGSEERRLYAGVFDGVAEAYARERPTYPEPLIDAACEIGGLSAGADVLEVGCGAAQLTAALLARGLRVHAIDPAPNMVRVARERVGAAAPVVFDVGRFEDAPLPATPFAAVFSATAFHWIDPAVGWGKAAGALKPGGILALLQFSLVHHEDTATAEAALRGSLERVAPEIAAGLPRPLRPAELLAGFEERRANVAEVWSFVGGHDLAAAEAATLFDDVRLTTVPVTREQTADELEALFRTTSLHARLGPERAPALEAENRRVIEQLGGTLRSRELAVLVTARRPG